MKLKIMTIYLAYFHIVPVVLHHVKNLFDILTVHGAASASIEKEACLGTFFRHSTIANRKWCVILAALNTQKVFRESCCHFIKNKNMIQMTQKKVE